jgi:hypothetical protein
MASQNPALTRSVIASVTYMNQTKVTRCTPHGQQTSWLQLRFMMIGRVFRNCMFMLHNQIRQAGGAQATDLRCTKQLLQLFI